MVFNFKGGRYAEGCGDNKWLFSCCIVPDVNQFIDYEPSMNYNGLIKANYFENDMPSKYGGVTKLKSKIILPPSPTYKHNNMLRRRMDDDDLMVIQIHSFVILAEF